MKTLYYTIYPENGYKLISLYDIVDNKPVLITEIEGDEYGSSQEELELYVEHELWENENDFEEGTTFTFELL